MKQLHQDKLNKDIQGAKLSQLTSDDEVGSFKLTLEDGRILALLPGKSHMGARLFASEEEYQERKAKYLEAQKQEVDNYDLVELGDVSSMPNHVLELVIGKLTEALYKNKTQVSKLDETIN